MSGEKLEQVRCDLCGADDPQQVLELRDRMFLTTPGVFHLVRCRGCGLLYLNPRPATAEIDRYYQESYAPFARSGVAGRVKRWTVGREVNALWSILAPPARIVDVGCATGDLLHAIRQRGNANVRGIEPNAHASAIARDRWGLDVFTGTLEEARLPSGSVDVALLSHTVEHLPSPSRTLGELARVITPGGALVLWLPNARSLAARLLGEWWIGYDAPRHFYAFTPGTLTRMLGDKGFVVRSIKHEWIGLEWSWAVRLMARERFRSRLLDRVLSFLHPALTVALTPVSLAAAVFGRAGRIRVMAVKRQ